MNELEDIKEFNFEGYNKDLIGYTINNINRLHADSGIVWDNWIEEGMKPLPNDFKIDFEFFSSNKKSSHVFVNILKEYNYEVTIKSTRTILIFKSQEIKVSIIDNWDLKKLNEMIEKLGLLARKYNCLIEGYGALIKKED